MVKNKLNFHSKGRSHLYQNSIFLQTWGYNINFVTFWPRFKFKKLRKVVSFYVPYIIVKKIWSERVFFKLFRRYNIITKKIIIDINLIECYDACDKLILDMPTNFPFYQDQQWEIEENQTGIKIERRKSTNEKLFKTNLINYFKECAAIIILNNSSKNTIPKKYHHKIFVIPPVEINQIKNKIIPISKVNSIICIGIVCPSKGYHYMINGLSKLNREFTINFYGKINHSYKNYLKQKSSELLNLQFHGHLKQKNLFEKIPLHDVMIFPSVSEGFPLSAIQSLARNLPVFASVNSNLKDILPDVCLYKTRNIDDFVLKFKQFEKQKQIELSISQFNRKKILKQWEEIASL